jgi:hypothetical protein
MSRAGESKPRLKRGNSMELSEFMCSIVEFESGSSEMVVGHVPLRWSSGSFLGLYPGFQRLKKQCFHPGLSCDVPLGLR